MSDLAQYNGTMMDDREFIRWYLDTHFERISNPPYKVYQVAQNFKNNIVICALFNHLVCVKYGRVLDTFNSSDRIVEDVWVVE